MSKPKGSKSKNVETKTKRGKKDKQEQVDLGVMIYLNGLKETRRKDSSNWNDPKSASMNNRNEWPTGKANANYKPNQNLWLVSDNYGKNSFYRQ